MALTILQDLDWPYSGGINAKKAVNAIVEDPSLEKLKEFTSSLEKPKPIISHDVFSKIQVHSMNCIQITWSTALVAWLHRCIQVNCKQTMECTSSDGGRLI